MLNEAIGILRQVLIQKQKFSFDTVPIEPELDEIEEIIRKLNNTRYL